VRKLTHALTFIAACLCAPVSGLAGDITAAVAGPAGAPLHRNAYNTAGSSAPALHQRYYGMHGYWSPTWRYPRSLYYHRHTRTREHGSIQR